MWPHYCQAEQALIMTGDGEECSPFAATQTNSAPQSFSATNIHGEGNGIGEHNAFGEVGKNVSTGLALQVEASQAANRLILTTPANGYPGATGNQIVISGSYRITA